VYLLFGCANTVISPFSMQLARPSCGLEAFIVIQHGLHPVFTVCCYSLIQFPVVMVKKRACIVLTCTCPPMQQYRPTIDPKVSWHAT